MSGKPFFVAGFAVGATGTFLPISSTYTPCDLYLCVVIPELGISPADLYSAMFVFCFLSAHRICLWVGLNPFLSRVFEINNSCTV